MVFVGYHQYVWYGNTGLLIRFTRQIKCSVIIVSKVFFIQTQLEFLCLFMLSTIGFTNSQSQIMTDESNIEIENAKSFACNPFSKN